MKTEQKNEAIIALETHVKKLEKQKAALKQKFDYPHSKEFQEERSKLLHESLSFDKLKEIEKNKRYQTAFKSFNFLQEKNGFCRSSIKRNGQTFGLLDVRKY